MAYSPTRKQTHTYLNRKQTYTYNRQQNINQQNLSQYSPSIRSPKLNEQSQYTKHNLGLVQELRLKLQTVLKHNSHLLNENATLSQMVNRLKMEVEVYVRKGESQAVRISSEFGTVVEELKEQLRGKEAETVRLLDQISRLHDDCYRIEISKNNQIKRLSEEQEKQLAQQIRNIKKSNDDGRDIFQLQIKKLKQLLELRTFQFQSFKGTAKAQNQKLRSQIQQLQSEIKHQAQMKQIQLRELTQKHRQALSTTVKQSQRQTSITVSKLQSKVRKLKQDVINKTVQIEQTNKKSVVNREQQQLEVQNLQMERQRLIEQLNQLEQSAKQNLVKQREKVRQLSQMEIKNMENINNGEKDCLKSQINKLLVVCSSKTQQIKKLYNNITELKATNAAQKRQSDKLIEALRKRIKNLEEDSLEEIQLLKIKMAQLHQADIKGLEQYYESQVAAQAKQIKELQQQKQSDRQKIHKYLQQNDLLRRNFETQLTKYKAKIQDYKVKFAAAHLEFREQITSLGTKMELTSQTLLRQTEQKQKGAQFFEADKKKFHLLILGKDKQIASAYDTLKRLKQLHGEQINQLRAQIVNLKDSLASKTNQLKELRKQLEQQFQRKSQKIIAQRYQSPNDTLANQNKQLRDKIQKLQNQVFQKQKDIQFLQRQSKSLQQQVGLRAGFLQTMQLQSSAAIEDQRSKLKILMNQNQVAMKDYYETKLATKLKDIQALQSQLHQKQNDIRQLIVKYNLLQKRLRQVLDCQEKLSEFQKKIMSLGLDQNLVKNMGELFARYRNEK